MKFAMYQDALEVFDHAITLDPTYKYAHKSRGDVLVSLK